MIWCLGMYASGSTWVFNAAMKVAASVVPAKPVVGHYVAARDQQLDFLDDPASLPVVKSHDTDEAAAIKLAQRADAVLLSIRDPRDCITSLMLHQRASFPAALDVVEHTARYCARFASHPKANVLRYEARFFDDTATLDRIAACLGSGLAAADRARIFAEMGRPAIEAFIARLEDLPTTLRHVSGDVFDTVSQWHRHHAGRSGEIGRWRRRLTAPQVVAIEQHLQDWMAAYGYPAEVAKHQSGGCRRMTRPAPRNAREFFQLFADYTPEKGLRSLLRDVDFAGVEPRQIYFTLHGRAPEKREYAIPPPKFSPLEKYIGGFGGEEFRKNVIPRFLEAFPEKQRLLFLHIPKTAGSELSARLMERYPFLNGQILQPGRGSEDQICQHIRDAVVGLAGSDHLLVGGHNTLERYRTWRAIRGEDQLFGVVREPVRAMISQVNYILTRIFAAEKEPDPDTLGWRRHFQVNNFAQAISKTAAIELAGRVLRRQGAVPLTSLAAFWAGQRPMLR